MFSGQVSPVFYSYSMSEREISQEIGLLAPPPFPSRCCREVCETLRETLGELRYLDRYHTSGFSSLTFFGSAYLFFFFSSFFFFLWMDGEGLGVVAAAQIGWRRMGETTGLNLLASRFPLAGSCFEEAERLAVPRDTYVRDSGNGKGSPERRKKPDRNFKRIRYLLSYAELSFLALGGSRNTETHAQRPHGKDYFLAEVKKTGYNKYQKFYAPESTRNHVASHWMSWATVSEGEEAAERLVELSEGAMTKSTNVFWLRRLVIQKVRESVAPATVPSWTVQWHVQPRESEVSFEQVSLSHGFAI